MKSKITKYISSGVFILLFVLSFTSCIDFEFPVDLSFKRLFSSVSFGTGTITATTAEITFSKVPGVDKYIIELSEDSLQFTTNVKTIELKADTLAFVDGSTTIYQIKLNNLKGGVSYSARLKSISSTGETPDSKWDVLTFSTKTEQIFQNVLASEKTDISVVLRWNAAGSDVTHIDVISMTDNTTRTVSLTTEDKAVSIKLIEGLSGSTTYTANIYNGDNKRGTITFRTNESVPSEGVVLRLTGGEDLYTLLQAQSGNITVVLPAGSVYMTSWLDPATSATSYTLPLNDNITSLTFWGVEGDVKAKINCTTIKVGAGITNLKFSNIEYAGNSSASDYVLNEGVTRALTNVSFTNCDIHDVRGGIRLQSDNNYTVIDKVTFQGCTIHNIGGYGLTNIGVANAKLLNLEIAESTLYNMTDVLGYFKSTANSVFVNACTFYNCFSNNKYIFNFSGSFIPTTFTISNCIFGKMNSTVLDGTQTMKATNPKITDLFVVNSYKTKDFYINSGYPMSGINEYSATSNELFVNPTNLDFRIKDLMFSGSSTAGDPRWR